MPALAAAIVVLTAIAAFAHHGWGWAEEEQTELTGKVVSVVVAPPHPSLDVEAADGLWKIELGNPRQTERAGFDDMSAKPGDEVVVLGNRSLDANEKRMKAVRITVAGKVYDIYPERIRTN
ncbi:MAG: DUF6152 family protein [Shinella sp.]